MREREREGGRVSAGGGEAWAFICNYGCAQTRARKRTNTMHTRSYIPTRACMYLLLLYIHVLRYWIGPDAAWNCFDFSVVVVGLATQLFPSAFGSFSGVSVALTKLTAKLTHETMKPLCTKPIRWKGTNKRELGCANDSVSDE